MRRRSLGIVTVERLSVDTKSTGRPFQAMVRSPVEKSRQVQRLARYRLKNVFGWKNVHNHEGSLVGKTQGNAGPIEDRMKQLDSVERFPGRTLEEDRLRMSFAP
jgi:hypothetical protein